MPPSRRRGTDHLHMEPRSVRGDDTAAMGSLGRRQAPPSPGQSYDHRWLLFIIPLVLVFFAIVAIVTYALHRRQRRRLRRNSLRNVTLVVADEEKRIERLSRGNSLSSRVSRMASVRSAPSSSRRSTRKSSTRKVRRTSIEEKVLAGTAKPEQSTPSSEEEENSHALPVTSEVMPVECLYEISPALQQMILADTDADEDKDPNDTAAEPQASETSHEFNQRVRVRSGISIIGDLPSDPSPAKERETLGRHMSGSSFRSPSSSTTRLPPALKRDSSFRKDASGVQRQTSVRSKDGQRQGGDTTSLAAPSSTDHTCSSNPFSTPTPSSSSHVRHTQQVWFYNNNKGASEGRHSAMGPEGVRRSSETMKGKFAVVRSTTPDPYEDGSGVSAPILAGVARSSTPSPALQSQDTLQRQDSKRSSVSSGRRRVFASSKRRNSAEPTPNRIRRVPSAPTRSPEPLADGQWTYTSRAAEWRAASSSPRPPQPMSEVNLPSQAAAITSDDGLLQPPQRPGQPIRRASIGVAGSRFIEALE